MTGREQAAAIAMAQALAKFKSDPAQAERAVPTYARWVTKSVASLRLSGDAEDWLQHALPGQRHLPAMVLAAHSNLPETTRSESIRRFYRPFELPFCFAEIFTASTRGEALGVEARDAFHDAFQATLEAGSEGAGGSERWTQFRSLIGSTTQLTQWVKPADDVDLTPIRGQQTRVRRSAARYSWRMDWQTQMAVHEFLRNLLLSAPELVDRRDELAAEAVRYALSGMAECVEARLTPGKALARLGGPEANEFPTNLGEPVAWSALRLWKYRPSALVLSLAAGGQRAAADALLGEAAKVVSSTIKHGPLDPEVRPVFGVVVRGWRTRLRHEAGLADELESFTPLVRERILSANRADSRPRPDRSARPGPPARSEPAPGQAPSSEPAPETYQQAPPDPVDQALERMDALVGLDAVKMQIRQIAALARVNRLRVTKGLAQIPVSYHMVLTGNPGTGKTTVARSVAHMFRAMGVLSKGHFIEAAPADFIGKYVGQTEAKTRALIESAAGGILFIDEAYELAGDRQKDYGHEAVAVLVAEMEKRRDDLVVLAAGYPAEMHLFLDTNPGLRSRFSYTLQFPDLDDAALDAVFLGLAERDGLVVDEATRSSVTRAVRAIPRGPGFGNARDVRKLYEQSVVRQASRVMAVGEDHLLTLLPDDIPGGTAPGSASLDAVWAELDALVGLAAVKAEVRTLGNKARLARLRRQHHLPVDRSGVGHLVFTGNPGTGKTTVARLMGQALAAVGALANGQVLSVGRADLVGEWVGQTAPRTQKVFERALGGVLFIDEAYSLRGGHANDFGHEAMATLLPLMEEHREHIVVILAGYTEPMTALLDMNPGLRSRIGRVIEFPDYSTDEMVEIFLSAAQRQELDLTPAAQDAVREYMVRMPRDRTFGNARAARAVLGAALDRQANRLASTRSNQIGPALSVLEVEDIPEQPTAASLPQPIGFVVPGQPFPQA